MAVDNEAEIMDRWWHPAKGDVVFDVGCSTGLWSIPAMKAGAFVYAFDPDPSCCIQFCQNASKNGFDTSNFIVMNVAIGAKNEDNWSIRDGWAAMGVPAYVMSEYLSRLDLRNGYVTLRTLDHFAAMTYGLDWIKIDVEGFECDVIEGGMECLRTFRPKLIIENHSNVDHVGQYATSRWPRLLELLHALNYRTEEMPYMGRSFLHAY